MDYEICIIGGGPSGYVAAIEAKRRGLSVIIIDQNELGGTCLNNGCIPSKSLLKAAEFYQDLYNSPEKKGFSFQNLSFDYELILNNSKKNIKRLKSGLETLIKKKEITVVYGSAKFINSNSIQIINKDKKTIINSKNFIIATGSKPIILSEVSCLAVKRIIGVKYLFSNFFVKLRPSSPGIITSKINRSKSINAV